MGNWSEGTINANGIKIHYYRTGGDNPPVVFNHGAGDDGLCWTHVAKALEKDYDVIMPDARGHGRSASGQGDYSTEARAADLAGLLQALNLDRPIVGGHSMGADTSLHFAAAYPDHVRGIFLEDPPIVMPGEILGDGQQTVKVEDFGKMIARFLLLFKLMPKPIGTHLARKNSPTYPDDEIIPWINSKKRVSFNFMKAIPLMAMGSTQDPFGAFKKVPSPILLFIGDREKMSIVSQETAQEIVKVNDKIEVLHLEGASHDIRRTRFDGFMPALQAFLANIYQ
ncbi:alpha/beta fold hydrolase [Chloroflexota bacterium]